jgi:hypothetical protein
MPITATYIAPFTTTISSTGPLSVCGANTSTSLNASGANSYQWYLNGSAVSGATSASYQPSQSGNYSATGLINTCTSPASNSLVFTVNALPSVGTPSISYTCTSATLNPNTPNGTTSFWQTSSTGTSTSIPNNYTVNANGTYYARTLSTAGCWSSSAASISVANLGVLPIVPQINVQSCIGDGNIVGIVNNPVASQSYAWYDAQNNLLSSIANLSNSLTAGTQKTYYVKTTSPNACSSSSASQTAIAYPNPVISSSADVIATSDIVTLSLSQAYPSQQWQLEGVDIKGETNQTCNVKKTGTYTVVVRASSEGAPTSSSPKILKGKLSTQNLNYITTRTVLKEGVQTEDDLNGLPIENIQESTTYFDGLGRPMQSVITKGSPNKNDIVQHIAYDQFGREATKYLPYTGGSDGMYKPTAAIDQLNYYKNADGVIIPKDSTPFAVTVFDNSPLDRQIQQGAPGTDFQPTTTGHTVKIDYLTNKDNEVILYNVVNNVCVRNTNQPCYAAGQLYVNQTTDENGSVSREYKDKSGHVVLTYKVNHNYDDLATYYAMFYRRIHLA